jgi:hypothetical protein
MIFSVFVILFEGFAIGTFTPTSIVSRGFLVLGLDFGRLLDVPIYWGAAAICRDLVSSARFTLVPAPLAIFWPDFVKPLFLVRVM